MSSLPAAAIFFLGIHFFISGTPLRGKIVGLIGEGPFRGLFSLMSLIGIIWLCRPTARLNTFSFGPKTAQQTSEIFR